MGELMKIFSFYKKLMNLKNWIALIIAGIIAFFSISEFEKKNLILKKYNIFTKKNIVSDKKIVFLSDIHDASFTDSEGRDKIFELLYKIKPDIILIGGDMMVTKKKPDIKRTLEYCENLIKIAPVYYANGNHELRLRNNTEKYGKLYDALHKRLLELGIIYLEDMKETFGEDIMIYGLDIDEEYFKDIKHKEMDVKYISQKLGGASDKYNILLAHSPIFLEAYSNWGSDLTLSGHFHGGTIRLPFDIGLMTPQLQFFSKKVVGLKHFRNSLQIISAGIGTHSIKIRFNNRPEIILINLRKEENI